MVGCLKTRLKGPLNLSWGWGGGGLRPAGRTPGTHLVAEFPEGGWEHVRGASVPAKPTFAEARAVVADEGHVHGAA